MARWKEVILGGVLLVGILVLAKSNGEEKKSWQSKRVVTEREAGSDLFLDFEERIWGN